MTSNKNKPKNINKNRKIKKIKNEVKKEEVNNKEYGLVSLLNSFSAFLAITIVSFIVGVLFGINTARTSDREIINGAGIKYITKCHNSYSNWYEIVWFDDKRERVYKNED